VTDDDTRALIDAIDALLPQTQCTRCGYAGCRPYAAAIANGEADINQCPPGGDATIRALALHLARPYRPLNPANGVETPPCVAVIDEARCIGCARCLPACPVDAIVGAPRFMHTVVSAQCNGCELCLPPCPVDCIEMRPLTDARGEALPVSDFALLQGQAVEHRRRYAEHLARLASRQAERQRTLAAKKRLAGSRQKGDATP
jgi:electron transport complex protein RnfB